MALACHLGPGATAYSLRWQQADRQSLRRDEVRVAVQVASVNPIDVKRAAGYGHRAFSLLGAHRRAPVLGNDFAGVVTETGADVSHLSVGDRVWGLVPTGPQGAHRSEVCVAAPWVRPLPAHRPVVSAAVLPYTFTTLWRALHAAGLQAHTTRGRHVLVHGAGGALGQLAIQLLTRWGARITAVCGGHSMDRSRALGAHRVIDRHRTALADLPSDCDASLNFGAWSDEADVIGRLHANALGHATTVHPLLAHIDAHGWIAGGWACWQAWRGMQQRLRASAPQARYTWTVFKPDASAMNAVQDAQLSQPLSLGVAHHARFDRPESAFAHVAQGHATRAVLVQDI